MTTWISSDWHISHDNIRRFSSRPFASIEEMEQDCIKECADKLRPGDRFIYLGDLHWAKSPHPIDSFLQKILTPKIQFFFVRGNHDYQIDKVRKLADEHGKYRITLIKEIFELQLADQLIVCSHYPIFSWNKKRYGAMHAWGHLHTPPDKKYGFGKSCEVGYDSQGKWLISVEEFIEQVKDRDIKAAPTWQDHHDE